MHTRSRKLNRSHSSGPGGNIRRHMNASARANRMRSNSSLSDGSAQTPTNSPLHSPLWNSTRKTAMAHLRTIEADEEAQFDTVSPTNTDSSISVGDRSGIMYRSVSTFLSKGSSSFQEAKLASPPSPLWKRKKRKPVDRVRLVKRDLGHYQSHNKLGISYIGHDGDITGLLSRDWFHFLLSMATCNSVIIILFCWTMIIVVYAIAYQSFDRFDPQTNCGLGHAGHPIDFGPAFAFSLETCTTVGYGLPSGTNAFFESNCSGLQVIIYAQMVTSMMFNAFLFAFFFSRLARCEKRGLQVIFSNKAIVRQIRKNDNDENDQDDRWLFQTRLYDLNSRMPLVEAHVRLYLLSYENHYHTQEPVQLQPLQLIDPNDDKGAVLYPSIPVKITHHIDENSPLNPRAHETITKKNITSFALTHQFNDPDNNAPEFSNCPVCGQTFDTLCSLQRHILYTAELESCNEKLSVSGTHRDEALVKDVLRKPSSPPPPPPPNFTKEELRKFLQGKEILVVLEGIEPILSGTFQAIQSYKAEDIVFGQAYFEPCMTILPTVESKYNHAKGAVVVDMVKFHTVIDEEGDVKRFVRPNRSNANSPVNSRHETQHDE